MFIPLCKQFIVNEKFCLLDNPSFALQTPNIDYAIAGEEMQIKGTRYFEIAEIFTNFLRSKFLNTSSLEPEQGATISCQTSV